VFPESDLARALALRLATMASDGHGTPAVAALRALAELVERRAAGSAVADDADRQRLDDVTAKIAPMLLPILSGLVDAVESDAVRAQALRGWVTDQLRAGLRAIVDGVAGWVPQAPPVAPPEAVRLPGSSAVPGGYAGPAGGSAAAGSDVVDAEVLDDDPDTVEPGDEQLVREVAVLRRAVGAR
jgi:hypothetical protein